MLALKIILVIATVLIGIFVVVWFLRKLANKVGAWFEKHEQVKASVAAVGSFVFIAFSLWLLVSLAQNFISEAYKSITNYKTPHEQRLEFLKTNCDLVDEDYEILNNGKSTYKCPNGKEYKE